MQNKTKNSKKILLDEENSCSFEYFPLLARTFAHAKRVEIFADHLFHSLYDLHKLSPQDNKILRTASYLHDIGWIYGRQGHNKIAGKIIREFGKTNKFIPLNDCIDAPLQAKIQELLEKTLKNYTAQEIILISLIARYHRKTDPLQRHKYFCDLSEKEQEKVRILSGILKVADALDYTHTSAVKGVDTELNESSILLILHCNSRYLAEKQRVDEKKQLLQDSLKKVLTCQIKSKKEKK